VLLINNYEIDETIHQLINEADDIIRQVRMKIESQLKEEIQELKEKRLLKELKVRSLSKEYQKLQTDSQDKLKEKERIIRGLKDIVETKKNEIQRLQNDFKRLRNMRFYQ
jgi:predicted RNase H-like nuclease (RuvC/YqgF family)